MSELEESLKWILNNRETVNLYYKQFEWFMTDYNTIAWYIMQRLESGEI